MRASGSADRRALGGLAAVAAAFAFAAWLAGGGAAAVSARLEGTEAGVRRALAAEVGGDLALTPPGVTARLERLHFTDLLVRPRDPGAEVVAVADAEGAVAWRGQRVGLAYLGRERFGMDRCPGAGWCVQGPRLPRLAALLALLAHRADAFDDGDAGRYRPLIGDAYRGADGGKQELLRRLADDLAASPRARFRPLAWQIRIERDTAQVGEDYEVRVGDLPPRRLRARLDLREEGGSWRITGGL